MFQDNFPEINPKWVRLRFVAKTSFYMSTKCNVFWHDLFIDKSILKFSEAGFKGCLADELSYIAERSGQLMKFLTFRLKRVTETDRERSEDLMAVRRGFGNELLEFHRLHNKKYKKFNSSEGLTPREIRELMN
jgi:hypothetical protein